MVPIIWVWVNIIMVSEYRRGWEDALDVILYLMENDNENRIGELRDQLKEDRITFLLNGPSLVSPP